ATIPKSPSALAKLCQVILDTPHLSGRLISSDGKAALIRAEITLAEQGHQSLTTFIGEMRDLGRKIEDDNLGLKISLGGLVILNGAFVEAAQRDIRLLFPAMALLLCVGLWLFTRSWRGVLGPLLVVGAAVVATMGIAGWLRIPITPILSIAPTIILGIGIADSLHLLISTDRSRRAGASAGPAFFRALRRNLAPICLTTLTTGIGFLSLLFSDSPPVRDLSLVTAIGVVAALFFTVTLLPLINAIAPGHIRARHDTMGEWIGRALDWVQDRRGMALAMTILMILVAVAGLSKIKNDDQLSKWFDASVVFRQDLEQIREAFGSTERVSWVIPLSKGLVYIDANVLDGLDAFSTWLVGQPEALSANSVSSTLSALTGSADAKRSTDLALLKRLAKNREPDSPLAQLLSVDQRETRIIVSLSSSSTLDLRNLQARARAWLDKQPSPIRQARASGPAWSLAKLVSSSADAMLTGTAFAFAVIGLCLGLILRSWRLGFVALVAMMVPPALVYGLWSWSGRSVGLAGSVVAATSLGLLADASIHILTRYQSPASRHLKAHQAVRRAFQAAGPALLAGFLILIAGFSVLTLSPFQGNSHLGFLTAATLALGLPVAILVLPFGIPRDDTSKPQRVNS
ncbi:MAG: MMPL family transporter, partial [Alphaproteobacteria bacterium]|nr:MMPL family transporter [Alphaproteobacteria bacterium]